ncbi:hypothetical protein [Kiloniella laminariae]|uniref:hypothetical protein n=1 Tax=Kiloniella laminariae TaxID=454162 RepID=UPI0003658AB9|nr:hypothetical protein [Kiloniella laminariae]
MHFLFKIFLLFCSRDFIRFYVEKDHQGLIDPEVRSNYLFQFLVWVILLLIPIVVMNYLFWDRYQATGQMELRIWAGGIFVIGLLFYIRPKIRKLETTAFAYSDGLLAPAVLIEKSVYEGKVSQRYEYEVMGQKYQIVFSYLALFSNQYRDMKDSLTVIYAQSAPEFANLYQSTLFRRRCLIQDKVAPEQAAMWEIDKEAGLAGSSEIAGTEKETPKDWLFPPWKQE